ncbi:hypothetical protein BH23GEM3_BH23GEM3_01010 [soil metagenome]
MPPRPSKDSRRHAEHPTGAASAESLSTGRFDIHRVLRQVAEAVEPLPKAALFELREEGFSSPFEQLVTCILSIRTRDEVMLPTARELFSRARTASEIH